MILKEIDIVKNITYHCLEVGCTMHIHVLYVCFFQLFKYFKALESNHQYSFIMTVNC